MPLSDESATTTFQTTTTAQEQPPQEQPQQQWPHPSTRQLPQQHTNDPQEEITFDTIINKEEYTREEKKDFDSKKKKQERKETDFDKRVSEK